MPGPSAAAALCKSVQPAVWLCKKIAKTAARAGGGCTVVRQGDVFAPSTPAPSARRPSPRRSQESWQVNPLFSRKMLPLTRSGRYSFKFLDGQPSWPAVDNDMRTPHDEY